MNDVNPSPMVRIESTEYTSGRVARRILVRLEDGNSRIFRIEEDGSAWLKVGFDRLRRVGWLPWPGESGHDETEEVRKLDEAVRGFHRD